MHKTGYVVVDEEHYQINKSLFDTGALSANYISQSYVEKYIAVFSPLILAHDSQVHLGDSTTTVNISHIITLDVNFRDTSDITHRGLLNFSIMPMTHLDMIIGIHSILFSFYDLFIDMLRSARKSEFNNTSESHFTDNMNLFNITNTTPISTLSHAIPNHPDYYGCSPTWLQPLDDIAPEEIATPHPCSFTLPLETIDVDRDIVLKSYFDNLLLNTNPEFLKAVPDFMNFMKSDIALRVFCPVGWQGIKGIDDFHINWSPLMPKRIRPANRSIRPALMESAKREFDRLRKYMYVPSNSPICSPLVIAPKATEPYVRPCGDYKYINQFSVHEQHYIPIVLDELHKAQAGRVFGDYDMKNAFHQLPLDKETSDMLSIMTPWGVFGPSYVPEGITSATGRLNTVMTDIFSDMKELIIVIFDNFLGIAKTFEHFFKIHVAFITRCAERGVILGIKKSKFGYNHATFFGFLVKDGTYALTPERKLAVTSLVMPSTTKLIQSFLGASLFFRKNIPFYAELTAPLNEMCTKNFSWNPSSWKRDYKEDFNTLKSAILASIAITLPNFALTFLLRTDASDVAWGGILIQVLETGLYECINLCSGKFSASAFMWDIHKKECYAIKATILDMEYFLRGKYFILECDNKNLLYMSSSVNPLVNRWSQYIQGFHCCIRHLPRRFNKVSDWISKQYSTSQLDPSTIESLNNRVEYLDGSDVLTPVRVIIDDDNPSIDSPLGSSMFITAFLNLLVDSESLENSEQTESTPLIVPPTVYSTNTLTLEEMFASVHGGRNFHRGIHETYKRLGEKYPGNIIPLNVVNDLIKSCPTCQKVRLSFGYSVPEENRHLKHEHARSVLGVDTLTVTPKDSKGNYLLLVVVEHFTKFISLYPCADHSAETTALALWQHAVRYGTFDKIFSDPGSDFMSDVCKKLNAYLGQVNGFSLTGRHESNGVERSNQTVLNYLRVLIHDTRLKNKWSDPTILGLVEHECNSKIHAETGFSPYVMKFGSVDQSWLTLPTIDTLPLNYPKILKDLNENLKTIRDISHKYQQDLVKKRDNMNNVPSPLNKYKPGEFVLFMYKAKNSQDFALNKLDAKFLGPYLVLTHEHNNVSVRNLITDAISVFHSNRLKLFFGSKEQAYEAALRDSEQYEIDEFLAYRGDPLIRTSISFYILFSDGCYHWKDWSKDLFDTIQYEVYCKSIPQLFPLVTLQRESLLLIKQINISPITCVVPGSVVYLDIRALGAGWYDSLNLPNNDFAIYVVKMTYTKWHNSSHTQICSHIPILELVWDKCQSLNHFFVKSWGNNKDLTPAMTIITKEFILEHHLIEAIKSS